MAEKIKWCVVGVVKLLGIGGRVHREEYTHAFSAAQALLQISRRLCSKYKQDVYLGDCAVYQVPEKRKQEPKKRGAVRQLDLFSSVPKRVA